jgi:hypothetical protein
MMLLLVCAALGADPTPDPGPFVSALWLVQRYGTPDAASPWNDSRTKAALAKTLNKSRTLAPGLIDPNTFIELAGTDGSLDPSEVRRALESNVPESRKRLLPKVAAHADCLTTSFDLIDEGHRVAGEKLAEWIVRNYRSGHPLHVIVVCTGNSRRSILGATMGNIAAAYYGMPEIRFHSGGTAPTAFNSRTVATLAEIGVAIEPTGTEAPRGEPATPNPRYQVRWGEGPGMSATEFSKVYSDPSNPQEGFAALMVCSEADAACPFVKGASLRISMPYLDPKVFDGGAYESVKYAERRDDLGRLMLAVMMQARHRLTRTR